MEQVGGHQRSSREEMLEHFGWTPEKARDFLDENGIGSEAIERWKRMGFGSHEMRAIIRISEAEEGEQFLLSEVYQQLREEDGLPPQRH